MFNFFVGVDMADFRVQSYTVKSKKLKKGTNVTFVLLADLHNKEYCQDNEVLLQAVKEQKPDGILIAGDMLVSDSKQSFLPAQQLVWKLQQLAPVYYGNGNHESRLHLRTGVYGDKYERFTWPLREAGVDFLENRSVVFPGADQKIRIHGYEMDLKYYGKFKQIPFREADLTDACGVPDFESFHILLAHNPVYFDHYADWGADLTVSGHLH